MRIKSGLEAFVAFLNSCDVFAESFLFAANNELFPKYKTTLFLLLVWSKEYAISAWQVVFQLF